MIISKSPLRMSFVGGGSDLPSYYREYGGAVISTSLDKFVYVMIKPRFESGIRLSYSRTENVANASELEHPIVREALEWLNVSDDIEIVSMADIPSSGTGLGSSSAFSCGLLKALMTYQRKHIDPDQLAELACSLEIERVGSPIGKQDQYAAAFGGLRTYEFHPDDKVSVNEVLCPPEVFNALQEDILTFYVGGNRSANAILARQSSELRQSSKASAMRDMVNLVWVLKEELEAGRIDSFGKILHENWILKRGISDSIAPQFIDDIYETALAAGALGGKLLGAGGGGFMIFHVPTEEAKKRVRKRLHSLREVSFTWTTEGSNILLNQGS